MKGGIAVNLISFITDNFGYDEPILMDDLTEKINNIKANTLRRHLNRLAKTNEIYKFEFKEGIFFVPDPNSRLKRKTLSSNKVLNKLYLMERGNRVGYATGLSFANMLSLTTQNPFTLELTTNKTSSKKRTIKLNNRPIILRKPKVEVNNFNFKILQVLDLLNNFDIYSEKPIEESKEEILNYLQDAKFTSDDLKNYLSVYPAKTSKKLIESGLYNEIARR